jgi:hypothetical protein
MDLEIQIDKKVNFSLMDEYIKSFKEGVQKWWVLWCHLL